jgi:hypothetical protein
MEPEARADAWTRSSSLFKEKAHKSVTMVNYGM